MMLVCITAARGALPPRGIQPSGFAKSGKHILGDG
jgi:hypothetical protein